MRRRDNLLFYEGDLHGTLDSQTRQISEKVNAISKDQFLSTPEEDLIEHLCSQLHIEPLELHEDSMEMEQQEVQIDVSGYRDRNPFGDRGAINVQGIRIVISVPFTGESVLWKLRPNSYQSVFPRADIREARGETAGIVELVFEQPSDAQPEQLKNNLESELKSIRFYVDAQRNQIEGFNSSAPQNIRRAVQARREKLEKHDGIADLLGIPLKRKDGTPLRFPQ